MKRAKYTTILCCRAGRKRGRETEQQNGLSEQFKFGGFSRFLTSLFQQQSLKRFFFRWL